MSNVTQQQVPEGYKQSDVGVIPRDWLIVSIDDITIKVGSGKTPSGGSTIYIDHGIPLVRSQNVGWGKLLLDDVAYISREIHKTFLGSELKEGDVLLNITGASIGRSSIANEQLIGGNVNQHVCIIRVIPKVDPRIINALILSSVGQEQIDSFQAGGNREGLNFNQVKAMRFPLPKSKEEQTAIANALSDVDALIASLEKLIAKKSAIKTAAMQQLLTGKKRLPPFDQQHTGYQQTELGEIPEDWEALELRGLLSDNPKYGINAAAVPLVGSLPVYLRITDISEAGYFRPSIKVGVNSPFSSLYKLDEGDLVLARTGASVGKSYRYKLSDGELIYAGFLIKVSPNPLKLDSMFLFQYLRSEEYWAWVNVMSMRSGQPGINGNEYGQLLIPVPSLDEQTIISDVLSDMDSEIDALEQRLNKTQQIKQGMMQELLTGRTRLPVDNN